MNFNGIVQLIGPSCTATRSIRKPVRCPNNPSNTWKLLGVVFPSILLLKRKWAFTFLNYTSSYLERKNESTPYFSIGCRFFLTSLFRNGGGIFFLAVKRLETELPRVIPYFCGIIPYRVGLTNRWPHTQYPDFSSSIQIEITLCFSEG